MDPDRKDFLLHLYDKLWENMNSKESRLWNYLSVYGAAIALAFAAGEYSGADLYALIIVLVLTLWAVLIVLNANWWYQRNQLMVTRIESAFPTAIKGVVPQQYRDPNFRFDRLYRGSVLALVIVALFLFGKSVLSYLQPGTINSPDVFAALFFLLLLFAVAVTFCVFQHESYIRSFYDAKLDLLQEDEREKPEGTRKNREQISKELNDPEIKARRAANWRWAAFGVLTVMLVGFDLAVFANSSGYRWLVALGIVFQAVAGVSYVTLARAYLRDSNAVEKHHLNLVALAKPQGRFLERFNLTVLVITLSFGASILLLAVATELSTRVLRTSLSQPHGTSTQAAAEVEQLQKRLATLSLELGRIQRSNVEVQRVLLNDSLGEYLKKTEANDSYLNRGEANQQFVTKQEFDDYRRNQTRPSTSRRTR